MRKVNHIPSSFSSFTLNSNIATISLISSKPSFAFQLLYFGIDFPGYVQPTLWKCQDTTNHVNTASRVKIQTSKSTNRKKENRKSKTKGRNNAFKPLCLSHSRISFIAPSLSYPPYLHFTSLYF